MLTYNVSVSFLLIGLRSGDEHCSTRYLSDRTSTLCSCKRTFIDVLTLLNVHNWHCVQEK